MTRAKSDQNVNILKQLGFVLNIEFFRSLEYRNKQYYNCYKFSLTEDAIEILKNPKKYFANYSVL
jgi:hypothetical protein